MKCYVVLFRSSWQSGEWPGVKDIHMRLESAMAQAKRLAEKEAERKRDFYCERFTYKNGDRGWGVKDGDRFFVAKAYVLEREIIASPIEILAGLA